LEAKIEEAKAKIQKLTEATEEAHDMVDRITSHVEEATEIRAVGNEENIKDAQAAQQAVAQATSVLEKLPETPSTWEVSYTFVTNPTEQPEGIIVVLKKVSADFAQEEAQTKTQTDSDQPVFDEDMKRCSILKKEDLSRSLR